MKAIKRLSFLALLFLSTTVHAFQPSPGTRVREGRAISFVVSTGVQIFPMPDLRYQSLREANLDLSQHKLALAHTTVVANDDVPPMHVLSQDPLPLASVHEGVPVTLILSKGPPSAVRVPNFVGMFVDDARDDATRARMHLGQVVWTPFGHSGPARGIVVHQKPEPGSLIDPFEPGHANQQQQASRGGDVMRIEVRIEIVAEAEHE